MSGDASLQCPVCCNTGTFESAETLRNRLVTFTTDKIVCPVCQEEVIGVEKLISHLLSHLNIRIQKYVKKEPQQSNFEKDVPIKAKAPTKNKTSLTTAASTSPVKYVKIYPKLPSISSSVISENGKDIYSKNNTLMMKKEKPLENNTMCNMCGLQFVDANILKMHMCLIHNIEDNSNPNITRYQCHLCPKNFKMRGSLMVHLRVAHFGFSVENYNTNHIISDDTNPIAAPSNSSNLKFLKNENKQWQCEVCRKYFTTKYFLKKHKRLHTGETPYACSQCNKTFTFQQSYHKHLLYHNDEKPHCCNVCGRAFKELSTLHNHQRIHTGEKPFSCETCGKCFRQRVSYLVHRRIHTGAMPYKCTACDKSFRYKVSQRTHKCQAQPPGTVVRQSGELVEKLKKRHTGFTKQAKEEIVQGIEFNAISQANAELAMNGAKLSLEDTETEHFDLIAQAFASSAIPNISGETAEFEQIKANNEKSLDSNLEELIGSIPIEENNAPSPSDILRNLCLSTDIMYDEIIM